MPIYWSNTLDDIIVQYNQSTDFDERETLYRTHIDKPLRTMIEILLRKFYGVATLDMEEFYDILTHVTLQLPKYNEYQGKSFSYFTVIIKHRILHAREVKHRTTTQYSDILGWNHYIEVADMLEHADDYEPITATPLYPSQLMYYMDMDDTPADAIYERMRTLHIPTIFKKIRQRKIATAVIALFHNHDVLTKYHKKEFLEQIRQQTGYKTVHIKAVISKLIPHIFP